MINGIVMLTTLIKSLPMILIFLYCFHDTIKVSRRITAAVIVAMEIFLIAISFYAIPQIGNNCMMRSWTTAGSVLVQCIVIHHWTTLRWGQNLFITFLMYNFMDDIDLLMQIGYEQNISVVEKLNWNYALKVTIYTAIVLFVVFIFMKHYLEPLVADTGDMPIWNMACVIPIMLSVIYRFGIFPNYFNQGIAWSRLMDVTPVVWTLGTVAIQFFVVNGLKSLSNNTKLEEELKSMKIMTEAHEKQYLALREHIEANRRIRHDFRQSLVVIRQYAREGNCDRILEHIQEYIKELESHSLVQICENVALNTILQYYKESAEKNGIVFNVEAQVSRENEFTEIDLCILVGNLLENAIEACERQEQPDKFIKLKIEMKGSRMLSLMISNSYGGQVRQKSERFLSSKREEFGIGISSVKHIAEKYHGFTKITHEDHVFTVYVLLNG